MPVLKCMIVQFGNNSLGKRVDAFYKGDLSNMERKHLEHDLKSKDCPRELYNDRWFFEFLDEKRKEHQQHQKAKNIAVQFKTFSGNFFLKAAVFLYAILLISMN